MCRFVGTVPNIWAWFGPAFGANPARNPRFPAGSLKLVGAFLAQPRADRSSSKGSRSVVLAKWFCWRHGVPSPKNHTVSRKSCFVGVAAEGGKAKRQLVSEKSVVLSALVPQASKKTLGQQNHFGIHLRSSCRLRLS